jgi:hypothetical protein
MLRSIPFPLSFSTYFRKKIKIKKPKKLNILSYNRILKINRIYDKFNKKFYYNKNGKLKRIKKKKKKIFKLKFNLWNSLINVNYSKHINYINKSLINLDQFNFLPSIQLNYILKLKNKMGIKYNKIVFTIFKQYKKSFLSNFYKVNMINKIKCYYNANINDNFIYICSSLKNIIYNTFYNKVFYINYDFNYLKSFYQFLQSKLLNNVLFTIKVKNYNNFLLLLGGKSSESFDVIIKRNNVINNYKKKNNLNHIYNKIYKIVKKFTANLIKKKKFTRHAIAKINLLFLKKLIFNNTKFNIIVNDKLKLFDNSAKVNYNMFSTFLNERPIKIKRYNFYFYRFVKKNLIMQKNILKKYHKYNYYITKKYHFLISFIKYYLRQLFYGLKYIFYKGLNNFNKFLLKLKLLFISIYYMLFVRFIKPFIKKKTKKLLNSNKVFTYNIMVTYKKAIKTW